MIYTGKLVRAEEGRTLNLVHETGPKAEIEEMAWERLLFLRDLAPEAFVESKRMRLGKFCADLREQMPARIARQVEIWHGDEAQARLRAGAARSSADGANTANVPFPTFGIMLDRCVFSPTRSRPHSLAPSCRT